MTQYSRRIWPPDFSRGIWPFCLYYCRALDLAYLASARSGLSGDRRLIMHRGKLGRTMQLVETSCYYEEESGYQMLYLYGDPIFASIEYPRTPGNLATPPFPLFVSARRRKFVVIPRREYDAVYNDDGTALVRLRYV